MVQSLRTRSKSGHFPHPWLVLQSSHCFCLVPSGLAVVLLVSFGCTHGWRSPPVSSTQPPADLTRELVGSTVRFLLVLLHIPCVLALSSTNVLKNSVSFCSAGSFTCLVVLVHSHISLSFGCSTFELYLVAVVPVLRPSRSCQGLSSQPTSFWSPLLNLLRTTLPGAP